MSLFCSLFVGRSLEEICGPFCYASLLVIGRVLSTYQAIITFMSKDFQRQVVDMILQTLHFKAGFIAGDLCAEHCSRSLLVG